ncbi:unnamed protein product, partial [Ectocarpus sp. 12 AP-2014]
PTYAPHLPCSLVVRPQLAVRSNEHSSHRAPARAAVDFCGNHHHHHHYIRQLTLRQSPPPPSSASPAIDCYKETPTTIITNVSPAVNFCGNNHPQHRFFPQFHFISRCKSL